MAAVIGNREISLGVMGGTLITAACYSGGDVFGCSPYDEATTAYLKATYPAYWAQIRDYGWDNPQLVPEIEANPRGWGGLLSIGVPIYSVRTNGAMADSSIIISSLSDLTISCNFRILSAKSGVNGMWGYMPDSSITPRFSLFFDTNASGGVFGTGYNSTLYFAQKYSIGTDYVSELKNGVITLNGETANVGTSATSNLPLYIGARGNSQGQAQWASDIAITKFYVKQGDEEYNFIPCKRNGDGKCGLFNMNTLSLNLSITNVEFEEYTPT